MSLIKWEPFDDFERLFREHPLMSTRNSQAEIDEGLMHEWVPAEEALAKMKADRPEKYEGHFILKREISFLEEYLRICGK